MLDFYNMYKEKILLFILYQFQRSIGIILRGFYKSLVWKAL